MKTGFEYFQKLDTANCLWLAGEYANQKLRNTFAV